MQTNTSQTSPFRLFQLISPSLPIGGFTYSQGLEWAVEGGWVKNQADCIAWMKLQQNYSLASLELPILARFYQAITLDESQETLQIDWQAVEKWSAFLYASRETKELRLEETQRGRAMFVLGKQLLPEAFAVFEDKLHLHNQLLGFALAAKVWGIGLTELKQGYLWSWAENLVTAGVKLIPLGQSAGQQVLLALSSVMPEALLKSEQLTDDEIGSFTPAIAMASSAHETQYTRLFRS